MLTLRNSATSLFLILALGLTGWSILISNHNQPLKLSIDNTLPDAYMENIQAVFINKQGAPSLKVSSPKMVHYPSSDSTRIEKPTVIVYRQSPQPWYINSDYALATHGIANIKFADNVVISHLADKDSPLTTMKTATLTLAPEQQTAETADAITITQPNTIVHAVGMLANMNDGTVKLISAAKGEYVPS